MPTISRQRTYVRPRRDASKRSGYAAPRRRPPMRKVSKKGAYKPRQKHNFIKKRAAVVETKRKTREELRNPLFWSGTDPA